METNPPSFPKSRVRALPISPITPSQTHKSQSTPLLLLFFLLIDLTPTASLLNQIPNLDHLYSDHCNDVVPKSETHPKWFLTTLSVQDIGFHSSYFTGGDRFFNHTSGDSKALIFRPNFVARTLKDGIFHVRGSMDLQSLLGDSTRRNLKLVNFRGPRIPVRRGVVRFRLDGYYSESDKKLCMIGKSRSMYNAGNFEPSVVLKLNYPKWSSIYGSLISGSLESVVSDKDDGENYFDAIRVLAFSVKHSYGYTFVGEDRMSSFPSSVESGESIGLSNLNDSNGGLCRLLGNRLERFELVYGSECGGGVNCNPLGGDVGYVPSSLVFYATRCTEERKM